MTFECTNCQLRYRIDDSLVPPDGARVKCRRCSTIIEVPAPVIELAPVDLELIPPTPVPHASRSEAPPTKVPREPEHVPAEAMMPAEPSAEAEGVTLEQQLAAEAKSVPPSPDIEHDSYEHFQAPPSADLPADPAFEHIGAATAQQVPPAAIEPAPPVFESTQPATEPAPPPFEAAAPYAAPTLAPAPVLEAPAPTLEPALASSSNLGAPTLEVEPPRLDVAALAPAQPSPTPHLSPAPAPAPEVAPPSAPEPRGAEPSPTGNVVPLTMGTPIPEGLSPEERTRHEKARRLARVLASDIAIYNREKKDRGMADGNLVAVLGYEIKKSWETYKERVGADFANSTPYFRDALNDLLAEGKKIF
jgi:predicted Zn finger-like uncharacterized protein